MEEAVIQVKGPDGSIRQIGGSNGCFFIAEIGQNHQGSLDIATHLIRESALAGVDCVKFQLSSLNDRFTAAALDKSYPSANSFGATYRDHRLAVSLTREELTKCSDYARSMGILFSASATDISSIDFLVQQLNVPFLKIGSGDVNNLPLIEYAAKRYNQLPLVISTGMVNNVTVIDDIYSSINDIRSPNSPGLALLHCVSAYPTEDSQVNLSLIPQFASRYSKAVIGYSGHEIGTEISLASVALGAKIIERHVTFDQNAKGSDHRSSLLPSQVSQLIKSVSRVEQAMGSLQLSQRNRLQCEEACYSKLGKFLVARVTLTPGTTISTSNVTLKVVNTEEHPLPLLIPGEEYNWSLGRTVIITVEADTPITFNHLASQ